MKGILKDLFINRDGTQVVSFLLDKNEDFRASYDTLINKELDIQVKEHREKRSLNANAYAWVLINEIANAMKLDKDEVYFDMLKHYGQVEVISVKDGINLKNYIKY